MRYYRCRSAAWVFGLAYLLASTLSGFLHSHAHEKDALCSAADHAHHAPGDGLGHFAEHEEHSPTSPPLSDDDCAACRFVAQCALVSIPAAEPIQSPVEAELRVAVPIYFVEPVYTHQLARAPPLV